MASGSAAGGASGSGASNSNCWVAIDVGANYGRVAVPRPDGSGPEVVANEQGNHSTPSYVLMEAGDLTVGEAARARLASKPAWVVGGLKNVIGMPATAPEVVAWGAARSLNLATNPSDSTVSVVLPTSDTASDAVASRRLMAGLLGGLLETGASYVREGPVAGVVLGVPLDYGPVRTAALLAAAKQAKMNNVKLVPEPIACALAYELDEGAGVRCVVVVDVAASCTRITLLSIVDGLIGIVTSTTITGLGGDQIDAEIIDSCQQLFKRRTGGMKVEGNKALTRLRTACEAAKITLATASTAPIELDSLFEGMDLIHSVSAAKLEMMIGFVLSKITASIRNLLASVGVAAEAVTDVIVAGGTSKLSCVQNAIKAAVPGARVLNRISAGDVVVMGLARHAMLESMIAGSASAPTTPVATPVPESGLPVSTITLNTLQTSLGVISADGSTTPLIAAGHKLPASASVKLTTVADSQDTVCVTIAAGESVAAGSNKPIMRLELSGIAPAARGSTTVQVQLSVSETGTLEATATCGSVTTSASLSTPVSAVCTGPAKTDAAVLDSDRHRKVTRSVFLLAVQRARQQLTTASDWSADKKAAVQAAVDKAFAWLDAHPTIDTIDVEECTNERHQFVEVVNAE